MPQILNGLQKLHKNEMKAEKIYANMEKLIENMSDERRSFLQELTKTGSDFPAWYNDEPEKLLEMKIIYELYIDAKNEMERDKAKSSGTSGVKKLVDGIVKRNANSGWRDEYKQACKTSTGKYVFCDGVMLVETDTAFGYNVNENPERGDSMLKILNDGYAAADKIIETTELPTPKYLTEYIKTEKLKTSKYEMRHLKYDFGNEKPAYNPAYLRDVLQAVGDHAKIYFRSIFSTSIFIGDNGRAVLMPVNKAARASV